MLINYKLHDSNLTNKKTVMNNKYFVFQAIYTNTNLMSFEHNSKILMETLMYTYLHKSGSSKERK